MKLSRPSSLSLPLFARVGFSRGRVGMAVAGIGAMLSLGVGGGVRAEADDSKTNTNASVVAPVLSGEPGPYDVARWKKGWPGCEWEDGVKEGHVSLVQHGNVNWLRVTYAIGGIGPENGGAGWRWPIQSGRAAEPQNRRGVESAELRYTVRFSKDFDWVKGGKLPGLCGGPENVSGGRPATGTNGFSARLMWRREGRGEAYVYHKGQKTRYGDSLSFPEEFHFPTETDVRVRMSVAMNTVGKADGVIRVWLAVGDANAKEQLMVERTDMEWRTVDTFGVDSLYFETFHGGDDASWAPTRACWAEFSQMRVTH